MSLSVVAATVLENTVGRLAIGIGERATLRTIIVRTHTEQVAYGLREVVGHEAERGGAAQPRWQLGVELGIARE